MFDYKAAGKLTKKVIDKFGSSISIVKKGLTGGYDINGDVMADQPDTIITGKATPLVSFKNREIDGKSIIKGDSYLMFYGNGEPEVNSQVTVNNKTFRIVGIDELNSNDGINVFIKLQLRK